MMTTSISWRMWSWYLKAVGKTINFAIISLVATGSLVYLSAPCRHLAVKDGEINPTAIC